MCDHPKIGYIYFEDDNLYRAICDYCGKWISADDPLLLEQCTYVMSVRSQLSL